MEEIKNIPDMTDAEPIDIAKKMISILDEKDAKGIKLLHVEDQTVLCDYFIICNGNSNTQIKAYAGELEYKMELAGITPRSMEGYAEATWIVMDYGCVIVHIFNRETRMFYDLEKLWSDSTEVNIDELLTEK